MSMGTHGHTDDTKHGIKHYGDFPGAVFLDWAEGDDNDMIYISNYAGLGGATANNEIYTKTTQTDAYRQTYNRLFQGVQPKTPAGYVPSAKVSAACAKYAEFQAQRHG